MESLNLLNDPSLQRAAGIIRALNHPLRQKILSRINNCGNKLTVTEIYTPLRLQQSVASGHLAMLRLAHIVTTQKDRTFIFYSVNNAEVDKIISVCKQLG